MTLILLLSPPGARLGLPTLVVMPKRSTRPYAPVRSLVATAAGRQGLPTVSAGTKRTTQSV